MRRGYMPSIYCVACTFMTLAPSVRSLIVIIICSCRFSTTGSERLGPRTTLSQSVAEVDFTDRSGRLGAQTKGGNSSDTNSAKVGVAPALFQSSPKLQLSSSCGEHSGESNMVPFEFRVLLAGACYGCVGVMELVVEMAIGRAEMWKARMTERRIE